MENSKRIASITLIAVFTLVIALNSLPSKAVTKSTIAKAQITKATAAVTKAEKIVKPTEFNINIAQKQLDLAKKEVSKIKLFGKNYTRNYTTLSKRILGVSKKIKDRKVAILAEEAERKVLIVTAEKAVVDAEKFINSEKTDLIESASDLQNAQKLLVAALEAVNKLDNSSETYKSLMSRLEILNNSISKVMSGIPAMKPVVYLYPTSKQNINVKMDKNVRLSCVYPKYSDNGWNVTAYPDGRIIDEKSGRQYYCLYWEGIFKHSFDMSYGFVVEGRNTADFLEGKLKKLGLTDKEANEFIIYWLPQLEKNKYNFIHFATEEYNKQAPLEITPKPDSLIRILMVYKPLNKPVTVIEQQLSAPDRKGFVVVEWGGMELK
jgi:hypothetical protein